jgi:multiple sugar transport system substrate-binding protein
MKITRRLSRAAIAVTLMLLVGAAPMTAQDSGSIQLWRFFNECASKFQGVTEIGDTTDVCAVQQILANQWNAQHPDAQVQTTSLVWPGIVELNSALAAGTPPDIMSLHAFRIPAYASKGALTDLTPYLADAGIDVNDMLPRVREAVTYNGDVYAVPLDVHGALWHLNLDQWKKAGLVDADGKPMLPVGLDEFKAACKKLLDAGAGPILGAGDDDVVGTGWVWASLYAQFGGKNTTDDGMPNMNTPEALQALNTLLELRDEGCITGGELAKTYESFVNGEVAGVVGGTWLVNEWDAQVKDPAAALKNYYVAPMPQIGDQPASWGGSHTWAIPLGANADPERVKAALGYVKYFWDHDLDWTRTGHSTVRKSILDSADYQALPHHAEYLGYADQAVYNPQTTWALGYDQVIQEEISAALLGNKTPDQALADAQSRLTDAANFQ